VHGMGAGWAWERRDDWLGGGYWSSAGAVYFGHLSIEDADTLQADQAAGGAHTNGSFTKTTFQLSRLQAIAPRQSLYLALGGQAASKNLDASEKLALGGARAVRAYSSDEALVDQGLIGTLEYRWTATRELTPFAFYDAARGATYKSPTWADTGSNIRNLRGTGLGLSWAQPGSFSINATVAWRAGTPPPTTDTAHRGPQFYVQAQKNF
jgi:hemolysin activation/secretion protein